MKIGHEELRKVICSVLRAGGTDATEATVVADVLVWNQLAGRCTQGVERFPVYLKRYLRGLIKSPCHPEYVRQKDTICVVSGNDGFGQYLGHIAMSEAIDLAEQHGVGLVGVNHSNHFGSGAYYVDLAAQSGKLGFALSNSVPRVAPFGGISAVLGTNPFAFGAPMKDQRSILVDFSTAVSSGAAIMKAAREGRRIPEDIVIDREGKSIVDAKAAVDGVLLPFGGAKGFCLALIVEILSGIITGAGVSHEIASLHRNFERVANVGHFFMAIDLSVFMPIEEYYKRIDRLVKWIKESKPHRGVAEILIPGEQRWLHYEKQLTQGIELGKEIVSELTDLAGEVGYLEPVPRVKGRCPLQPISPIPMIRYKDDT